MLNKRDDRVISLIGMCNELGFQYEAEEDSTGEDDLIANQELVPEFVEPFCPVQLVERWSPFPAAEQALGAPTVFAADTKGDYPSALALWEGQCRIHEQTDTRPTLSEPRADVFEHRLRHVLSLAAESSRSVLLVACRGFSFGHRSLSVHAVSAMKAYGYRLTSRAPF